MSAREQPDSVEWMRQRRLEHHAPKALLVHPTTVTADLRKVREALGDLG